jgi:hypothetical protein
MSDEGFTPHFTVFIDMLGFKDALSRPSETGKLLSLLQTIAEFRGDFGIDSAPTDNGDHITIRPAISAFSDSIVISYSVEALHERGLSIHFGLVLAQMIVSYIAWTCCSIGLLIRGGIAIGQLFHAGGIVIGNGLVDAYELESKEARYPRVLISDAISDDSEVGRAMISRDEDGRAYLDYMPRLLNRAELGSSGFNPALNPWIDEIRAMVEMQIQRLASPDNEAVRAKWVWFGQKFELCVAAQPTEQRGSGAPLKFELSSSATTAA